MLGLTAAAPAAPQPPPVSPLPSQSGPFGPPRPLAGPTPPVGADRSKRTQAGVTAAQDRALAHGPFPVAAPLRAISDSRQLASRDPAVRAIALTRARAAGAAIVRVHVGWEAVATRRPDAPADPADPGYDFAQIDAAVRDAAGRGLETLLWVSGAPAFAQAPGRWRFAFPGSWAPDPDDLRAFAAALARRYDGSFADPARPGSALPRVRYLQAWNEPNLPRYLGPQWAAAGGAWAPFAPRHFRAMLNAFYDGVKAAEPDDVVVAAGLAPTGDGADGLGRMAPVRFLHELLCLAPPPSVAVAPCPEPARFDVLAFHPLSVHDPDRPAPSSLDVSIADLEKIQRALDVATRTGRAAPARKKPLWITELNWQSRPPSPLGVPARLQAHWIARALHRLWVAGAEVVAWHFLSDRPVQLQDAFGRAIEISRPAGLYRQGPGGPASDRPKPFLRGFRFPFDPVRTARGRLRVWAMLPPGSRGRPALERRGAHGWRTIARLQARDALVNAAVRVRGAAPLRLRAGPRRSAAWRPR